MVRSMRLQRLLFTTTFGLIAAGCASGKQSDIAHGPEKANAILPAVTSAAKDGDAGADKSKLEVACTALAEEQQASIDRVSHKDILARLPRELGRCIPAGPGAWAVWIPELEAFDTSGEAHFGKNFAFEGGLGIVHIDENGKRDETGFSSLASFNFDHLKLRSMMVHDLDGNGSKELLLCRDSTDFTGRAGMWLPQSVQECAVFESRAQGVSRYENAGTYRIDDFADVDQDGRPDILTRMPFDGFVATDEEGNCPFKLCPPNIPTPKFLAHGRADGTFSLTDEAAVEQAKRECKERPAQIFEPGDEGLHFGQSLRNFACALVWGAKPSDLRAKLVEARRTMCRDPKDCGPFDDLEHLLESPEIPLPRVRP